MAKNRFCLLSCCISSDLCYPALSEIFGEIMIKINLLINTIKPLLYIVSLVVIVYLFLQYVGLKNTLGSGHWGKICSQDMVENGEIERISAIAFLDKDNCPSGYKVIDVWVKDNTMGTSQSKQKLIATPTVTLIPKPIFSISKVTSPVLSNGFNFKFNITNISTSPYITGVSLSCNFIDNKGNEYNDASFSPNTVTFTSKALLPGETQTVEFNKISISLQGGGGIDEKGVSIPRCQYDKNGNNVCAPVEGLKFKNCTIHISIPDKEVQKYKWPDDFGITVNFP